jgi:hypothetical protein
MLIVYYRDGFSELLKNIFNGWAHAKLEVTFDNFSHASTVDSSKYIIEIFKTLYLIIFITFEFLLYLVLILNN